MDRKSLTETIERQVAERAGLAVVVEIDDGSIVLSGLVDSPEARQAAEDVAASAAGELRIENNLEVETLLPADVDELVAGELASPTTVNALEEQDMSPGDLGELPIAPEEADTIVGPQGEVERYPLPIVDDFEEEQAYLSPTDPVVGIGTGGQIEIVGGFSATAMDSIEVEPSAEDDLPGDEALADAVRRELREDAVTSALPIDVEVRLGIAFLRGRVNGPEDAEGAEEVAARVPGIIDVVERLEVEDS